MWYLPYPCHPDEEYLRDRKVSYITLRFSRHPPGRHSFTHIASALFGGRMHAWNIIQRLMKILYVADGRSPIAQNWIRHFVERGDDVYLASTFACALHFPVKELEITPVAFSSVKKVTQRPGTASARTVGLRTAIRQWFGPFTIRRAADRLRGFIERVQPDVVHAMRIPYEGMVAADAYTGAPLIVSTWGNDFTLHASSTRFMEHYTQWTMKVADALHAD